MATLPIQVREVWHYNLATEMTLIQQSVSDFPLASIDTEFPGTVFNIAGGVPNAATILPPSQLYDVMKQNVDALNLIQLGLTLADDAGNLPTLGTAFQYVWQFNFRDFDVGRDLYNADSIALLEQQGIDFSKNKSRGIDSSYFSFLFKVSGLGMKRLTWITFHGCYDFGFLIKILTRRLLPEYRSEFMMLVRVFFGAAVCDLKKQIGSFRLHGGLEQVARTLNLDREVGRSHQAGSDSLLTMRVFLELKKKGFKCAGTSVNNGDGDAENVLYGL